jgi:predicted small metal-binding protein
MKVLSCGDLMSGCTAVFEGKDVAEVLVKAKEHAEKAHGIVNIPPEMASKVMAAIKDK